MQPRHRSEIDEPEARRDDEAEGAELEELALDLGPDAPDLDDDLDDEDEDDASVGRIAVRLVRRAPEPASLVSSVEEEDALGSLEALPEIGALPEVAAHGPVIEEALEAGLEALWGDGDGSEGEVPVLEAPEAPAGLEIAEPGAADEPDVERILQEVPAFGGLPFTTDDLGELSLEPVLLDPPPTGGPARWRPTSHLPFSVDEAGRSSADEALGNPEDLLDDILAAAAAATSEAETHGPIRLPFFEGEAQAAAPPEPREDGAILAELAASAEPESEEGGEILAELEVSAEAEPEEEGANLAELEASAELEVSAEAEPEGEGASLAELEVSAEPEPKEEGEILAELEAPAAPEPVDAVASEPPSQPLLEQLGIRPSEEALAEFEGMSFDDLIREVEGLLEAEGEATPGPLPSDEGAPGEVPASAEADVAADVNEAESAAGTEAEVSTGGVAGSAAAAGAQDGADPVAAPMADPTEAAPEADEGAASQPADGPAEAAVAASGAALPTEPAPEDGAGAGAGSLAGPELTVSGEGGAEVRVVTAEVDAAGAAQPEPAEIDAPVAATRSAEEAHPPGAVAGEDAHVQEAGSADDDEDDDPTLDMLPASVAGPIADEARPLNPPMEPQIQEIGAQPVDDDADLETGAEPLAFEPEVDVQPADEAGDEGDFYELLGDEDEPTAEMPPFQTGEAAAGSLEELAELDGQAPGRPLQEELDDHQDLLEAAPNLEIPDLLSASEAPLPQGMTPRRDQPTPGAQRRRLQPDANAAGGAPPRGPVRPLHSALFLEMAEEVGEEPLAPEASDGEPALVDPFAAALAEIERQQSPADDPLGQALAEMEGDAAAWETEEEPVVLDREVSISEVLPSDGAGWRTPEGVTLLSGGPGEVSPGGPRRGGDPSPGVLPWEVGGAARVRAPVSEERPWWMPPEVRPAEAAPAPEDPWAAIWERRLSDSPSGAGAPREPSPSPAADPPGGEGVWRPLSEAPVVGGPADPVAEALKILQRAGRSTPPRGGQRRPLAVDSSQEASGAPAAPQGEAAPAEPAPWHAAPQRTAAPRLQRQRSDRRQHDRVLASAGKVYFRRRGRIATGDLKDLSFTGCAVLTRTPLPPGSEIPLGLELEGMRTVRTLGRVVWVRQEDPYGEDPTACMGVTFTGMEEESRRLLATFLSRAAF